MLLVFGDLILLCGVFLTFMFYKSVLLCVGSWNIQPIIVLPWQPQGSSVSNEIQIVLKTSCRCSK